MLGGGKVKAIYDLRAEGHAFLRDSSRPTTETTPSLPRPLWRLHRGWERRPSVGF